MSRLWRAWLRGGLSTSPPRQRTVSTDLADHADTGRGAREGGGMGDHVANAVAEAEEPDDGHTGEADDGRTDVALRPGGERPGPAEQVGLALRAFRREHGLSQRALADRWGLCQALVARVERRAGELSMDTSLSLLARAGMTMAVLDDEGRPSSIGSPPISRRPIGAGGGSPPTAPSGPVRTDRPGGGSTSTSGGGPTAPSRGGPRPDSRRPRARATARSHDRTTPTRDHAGRMADPGLWTAHQTHNPLESVL